MDFGAGLRQQIVSYGQVEPPWAPLRGCSDEEIEQLRTAQEVDFLPKTYRQFMAELGHMAGSAFSGYDYQWGMAKVLKEIAMERFEEEDISLTIAPDAFVFLGIQGDIFGFFHTISRDDNPLVYTLKLGPEIGRATIVPDASLTDVLTRIVDAVGKVRTR